MNLQPRVISKPHPWAAIGLSLLCLGGTLLYWQALRTQEVAAVNLTQPEQPRTAPGRTLSTVALAGGGFISFLLGFGLYTVQYGRRLNQLLREEIEDHEEVQTRLRRSEAQFRQVVEHISEVFWLATPDKKRILYLSPAYETIWGRTCESLIRNPEVWDETMHPEDRERIRASGEAQPAADYEREYRILRPDGAERWIRERAYPVRNPRGAVTAVAGIAQDITAYKEAALAVQRQHALMTAILNGVSEAIYVKDRHGRYLLINRAGAEFLNKMPDEVVGRDDTALLPAEFAAAVMATDRMVLNEQVTVTKDEEERRSGGPRTFLSTKYPYWDMDGRVAGVIGVSRDVTQQRLAESRLRQSEAQLYQLFFEAPVGLVIVDDQKRLLKVNQAFCDLLGYEEQEIVGNSYAPYTHPDDLGADVALTEEFFSGARPTYHMEKRYIQKSGEIVWVSVTVRGIRLPHQSSPALLAAVENITERKRAEESLRFMRFAVDHAGEAVFWIDRHARLHYVNDTACARLGYTREELLGMTVAHIDPSYQRDTWTAHWEELRTKSTLRFESQHRTKAGELYPVEIVANYIVSEGMEYSVAFSRDITERKQADQALLQREAQYRSLYEDNPSMYFTLAIDGTVLAVNRFGANELGYGVDELIGQPVLKVFHPEDRAAVQKHLQECLLQGQGNPQWEFRKVRKDGSILWVRESLRVSRAPDGRRIFLVTCHDVTARMNAEKALRLSEQAMRELYEVTSAPQLPLKQRVEAILDLGRRRFSLESGLLTRATGGQLELTHARSADGQISPGTVVPLSGSPCARTLTMSEPLYLELGSGSPFCHHVIHTGLHLQSYLGTRVLVGGEPYGTLCFVSRALRPRSFSDADKTFLQLMARWIGTALEQERAECALRENESRTRAIVESSMDAVVVMDGRGLIREWNPQAVKIFGWSREDAVGRRLSDTIIPVHLREAHERGLQHFVRTGTGPVINTRVEITALRRDGSEFPVELTVSPLILEEETIFGAFVRDITERKRAEESLKERARLATFTAEISQTLNRDMATDEILRSCAEMAVHHLDLAFARIWTVGPGDLCENCFKAADCADRTECLHLRASAGLSTNLHGEYRRVPMGALKIGRIAQGTGLMFTNDILGDDRLPNKEWMGQNGLQSFAGFPLVIEGKVYGVLGVFARMPLSEAAVRTLESVCNGIAATIARKQTASKLELTQFTVDHAVDAIYWVDPRAKILEVNDAACAMVGYSKDELCAMTVHDLNPDFPEERWPAFWADSKRRGTMTFESGHRAKNGRLIPVEITVNFLSYEGTEFHCAFVRNIAERKKTEGALKLFRALLDQATDAVEVIDPATGRFLDCNENAHSCLGYSREEFLSLTVPEIAPIVTAPTFRQYVAELQKVGGMTLETVHRRKNGSTFPIEVNCHLARLDREYLLAIVRDISERKRAEGERTDLLRDLKTANTMLGRLSHQLMQVQETERQQLARDLHDEIGQALTAVMINLQSLSQRQDPAGQAPEMRDSLSIVQSLVQHVRDLCLDLRPSILDDLGLIPALRWYVTRQAARAGWALDFQTDDEIPALPESVQVACFRIAQEALTNVMRHAGAQRVSVSLRRSADRLDLEIRDDGVGIDLDRRRTTAGHAGGLGLIGMQERARFAGGEWTIESTPGHGTTVRARLPINGLAVTKTGRLAEALS
jgi:PAS domain S-box-containing protein